MAHIAKKACLPMAARVGLLTSFRSSARPPVLIHHRASMASVPSQCPTPVPKMVHSALQVGIVPDNKRYKRLMTLQTHFCNAARVVARGIATTAGRQSKQVGTVPNNAAYKKLQTLQSRMCEDDGLLVWQKLGAKDAFGYQLTMGLLILGFIPAGYQLYKMSFPQKKD